MKDAPIWDIKDRLPVETPDQYQAMLEGEDLLSAPELTKNVEIDRYEKAVRMMPHAARARYLRCMDSIGIVARIIQHGIRHGLTKP